LSPPSYRVDERARELFAQALELVESARSAFLSRACSGDEGLRRQLLQLLAAHDEADRTLVEAELPAGERAGDRIGCYKLLQRIGEGGFGVVWMAEQEEPVRRKVALKVLKPGMDTAQVIGRFEAERQALAMMDHPNIARVFDAGAAPHGRPYFVMELVRGVPITQYCDQAELSAGERLALFADVCRAVQHAHQKGVIHRDIKPSNVLVTLHDGVATPKVIDFGIAKATSAALTERTVFTEFRQMLGTPEYMAPEQAALSNLDVDTRADVYSLGVLLYELLTGTRPFRLEELLRVGYVELLRTIQQVDPPKPSTRVSTLGEQAVAVARQRRMQPRALVASMRGDLDWIVMKALEKERGRRYESAAALAEDVQRHLRHEPVLAGPPGRAYRLRKYVRRNRLAVTAAVAVAVALLAGAVASGLGFLAARQQARQAREAEGRAKDEREAAVAARAEEALQKDAALAAHRAAKAQEAATNEQRRLAEQHAKEASAEAAKAKHVVALLKELLASSNPHASRTRDYTVRQLLDDFAKGIGDTLANEPGVEETLRRVMGQSYLALGLPAAALPHLERTAELCRSLHGEASLAFAESEIDLAACLREAGSFDRALSLLADVDQRLLGESPDVRRVRAQGLATVAHTLSGRGQAGDRRRAERAIQRALAMVRELPSDDLLSWSLSILVTILIDEGRWSQAQPVAEELLARDVAKHGEDSLEAASDKCNLAHVLDQRGTDPARAEALHREALAVRRQRLGDHLSVAQSLNNLAAMHLTRRDLTGALALYTEARDLLRRILGEHVDVAMVEQSMAMTLQGLARCEAARPLQEGVVATLRRLHRGDHPDLANALACLGDVLILLGERTAAGDRYAEAIAMYQRLGVESDVRYAIALEAAAGNLLPQRRAAEAEPLAREAVEQLRANEEAPPERLVVALHTFGLVLLDLGRLDAAGAALGEALERARRDLGDDSPRTGAALEAVGELLAAKGDLAAAEAHFRRALASWQAHGANVRTPEIEEQVRIRALRTQECLARVLEAQDELVEAAATYRILVHAQRRLANPRAATVTLSALVRLLGRMHEHAEAEAMARLALELSEDVYGAKHSNVAAAMNDLAEALSVGGKHAAAVPLYRQSFDRLAELGQGESLDAATYLGNLGRTLLLDDQLDEAEAALRRAIEVFEHVGAKGHANHALCLEHLAGIAKKRGDRAASLSLLRQALSLRRGELGNEHVEIADRLALLVSLLLEDGSYADAEPLARECLAIRQAKLAGTWLCWSAQALVGRALAGQEKVAAAEPLLIEACTKMQPPAAGEAGRRAAVQALVGLYEAQGEAEQAAVWRARLEDKR
jgi:serine/threonine protein kinase